MLYGEECERIHSWDLHCRARLMLPISCIFTLLLQAGDLFKYYH